MEDQAPRPESKEDPPGNASDRKSHTATIAQGPEELPLGHEADSLRGDHSITISTQSRATHPPEQQNGNVPGASFEPTGVFERALTEDQVHAFSSPPPPQVRSEPRNRLKQAKVVHGIPNQARIARLFGEQERKTVTVDGGNNVDSQLSVLGSVEGLPANNGTNRIWTETRQKGHAEDKKRKTVYHCNQQDCGHKDSTAQKARQHFVACHVEGAGWKCPFDWCLHTRTHKRLDDLKNHHMVPAHDTRYYRGRESLDPPPNSLATLSTSIPHPYPTRASNSRTQDHQLGPQRTNSGATRRLRNAHRHTDPLNTHTRPTRNVTAATTAAEPDEPWYPAADASHPSRSHPPTPAELNYQRVADMNAFSPPITLMEGASRSTPILTAGFLSPSNELPSALSPTPSHNSQFNDPAGPQSSGLPQGVYPPSAQTFHDWLDMEVSSLVTHASVSPRHALSRSHVPSQIHTFPTHYPHDDEVARMRMRDGLPGHDPPVHEAPADQAAFINPRVSNPSTFSPAPASPYSQRPRHQPIVYGAPSTSSHVHSSPPHVEPPRNYAASGNTLQPNPYYSWTSYPLNGRNVHNYDQPSTSDEHARRLPSTSTSFNRTNEYPSNQGFPPSYAVFPSPSRQPTSSPDGGDEWAPYDESNFNPNKDNFGG